MNEDSKILSKRRRFLTGIGVVATGATLAASTNAAAQRSQSGFTPARHSLDSWMDELGGIHRAFIDSSLGRGGMSAMNYARNILMGNREDYGGSDADYALIICFRHMATPLGYNHAMWEKYGEGLSRFSSLTTGNNEPRTANPILSGSGENTIETLASRGVHFAICNRATHAVSRSLARNANATEEEIYQELTANNIPNSRFVPAGVLAATRSQEYGYSLLYADD